MTRGGAGARFRQRKLSTKQSLQILREDQLDHQIDDEQQRHVLKVDTGVEKAEEIEHHLQAAISAAQAAAVGGTVTQIYIPTPVTTQSSLPYDQLYPARYSHPATYIRFSSTVEECIGIGYCMTADDDRFWRAVNAGKPEEARCSDDQFEAIVDFFEQQTRARQPFATVDNAPVIALEEMIAAPEFLESVDEKARQCAAEVYEHWKSKRAARGNRPLMASLKVARSGIPRLAGARADGARAQVETGRETDDGDPYVCFRRREVRQIRKTRGRDAQSVEKLRKLRKELEDARTLVGKVRQRELDKREMLVLERTIFEQRLEVKSTKRKLGLKGDDEDLINQKVPGARHAAAVHTMLTSRQPQKKKSAEHAAGHRPPQLRLSLRADARPAAEPELVLLQDTLAEKDKEIQKEIERNLAEHRAWLHQRLDFTMRPIGAAAALPRAPEPEPSASSPPKFRAAITEYLPSPPPSATWGGSPRELDAGDADRHAPRPSPAEHADPDQVAVEYRPASAMGSRPDLVSYRRRIGRGGRLMIDRRGMRLQSTVGIDPAVMDRFRFDRDDDADTAPFAGTSPHIVDPYDKWSLQYRANMMTNPVHPLQTHAAPALRV
ncbi:MAG: Enhancer of polycomb-like protein 1 [Phylliscum demangeonii]|nr:MAG: Enhancer of polycomb-like protein 1 [Phylliscum demangeonii]